MMKTTGLVILLWYIIVKSQNCIFRFSWMRFFLVSTMGSFSCCSRSTVRKLHRRKRLQTFEPRLGMPRKKRGPIRRNWRRYRKWRAKVQSIKHGRHVFFCNGLINLLSVELKKSLTLTFGMNPVPQQSLAQPGLVLEWVSINSQEAAQRRKQQVWMESFPQWDGIENWISWKNQLKNQPEYCLCYFLFNNYILLISDFICIISEFVFNCHWLFLLKKKWQFFFIYNKIALRREAEIFRWAHVRMNYIWNANVYL